MYYKLDENKKVVPSSIEEWARFIEGKLPANYRHVGDEIVDGKRVSTVFIGLDYGISRKIPIVFETMVFDSDGHGIYQTRCSTWEEAELMHKNAIKWIENGCIEEN